MEDLKSLRIKKQMLLIELSAIEQKISLVEQATMVKDVPESESSKNIHTSNGKTTDHTQGNSMTIPQQTAAGKESTNPLMAAALPKSILKETATPLPLGKTSKLVNTNPTTEGLSKMTILSSVEKQTTQQFAPDYKKALSKKPERYYVIYKGSRKGIYTDWAIVDDIPEKSSCRKFRTEASARLSLATYEEASSSKTKKSTALLRPKIHKIKEANRDQRFKVPNDVEEQVSIKPLKFEDFRLLWNKVRAAGPEDLIHEKFYSTDKKTKSLYNFLEGTDAALIYDAFSAGLVDNIYPSANLQELKFFPRPMVESIKNFRKKVLKAKDDPIYIKIISSLPEWQHEDYFAPYHYMEVGLATGKREISQSQVMEDIDLPQANVLLNTRITGLRRISEKIIDIITGSKKKVNYASSHCMITSWSYKTCSEEDVELASKYGRQFKENTLDVTTDTKAVFCRHINALFEDHYCCFCKRDSPTKEDPSTEEITSSDNGSA